MAEYIERTAVFEQFDNADADVCETDDFCSYGERKGKNETERT